MANGYQLVVRLDDETKAKLEFIVNAYHCSYTELVRSYIESEYDNLTGNPKLTSIIEQMQKLGEEMKEISGFSSKP